MKHYEAPRLVDQGVITELTQGPIEGKTDPDRVTLAMPAGSVGFNL